MTLRIILLIFVFAILSISNSFAEDYNKVYEQLKQLIHNDEERILSKQHKIDSLKKIAAVELELKMDSNLFVSYLNLGDEFRLFNYKESFFYYKKASELANKLHYTKQKAQVKNNMGALLVSGGLYYEAIDTLKSIKTNQLSKAERINLYGMLMRAHFDLKTFISDDYYQHIHARIANCYIDSAQKVQKKISPELIKVKALHYFATWQQDSAMQQFNFMLNYPDFNLQDKAIAHSCLALLYGSIDNKNPEKAKTHFAKAAINDFLLVNKEGQALIFLAEYLFDEGKYEEAYELVLKARDDAEKYGSLMRKRQAANMLAKIEGQVLKSETAAKLRMVRFLLAGIIVLLIAIVIVIIVFRKVLNLSRIKSVLELHNTQLNEVNAQLAEANKIKEQYIGEFFVTNSAYIDKLNGISVSLNNIIIGKKTDKLSSVLRKIQPKKEQEALMHRFDELFIKLFPSFVEEFRSILKPNQEVIIKTNHLLNTELRVLALKRIGIDDNEQIARILNVSVNTVYSYKTKLKNKITLADKAFDTFLMKIPSA